MECSFNLAAIGERYSLRDCSGSVEKLTKTNPFQVSSVDRRERTGLDIEIVETRFVRHGSAARRSRPYRQP